MIDPTTLSLADLALAAGAIGAHRLDGDIVDIDGIKLAGVSESREMDLLLAAANRLPGVVARVEALEAENARLTAIVERIECHLSRLCVDCGGPLEPCQCQPDCPGGQCARKCHANEFTVTKDVTP